MSNQTYTIKQVAERFGVNPDTLRNWERKGLVVPDRVGTRGDRVYTQEHIDIIVNKQLAKETVELSKAEKDKMSLTQLKTFLWTSADILRGSVDSADYKKYIFGLLFYKRMSDVWQEEYEKAMSEYHDDDIARADYNHRFQIPEGAQWSVVANTASDIGLKLNQVFDKITTANSPKLDKIFADLDFANDDRFPNETLQSLINHFSKHNFGETYFSSDILGDAYEYLIQQFAAGAGKKGGEFYTPREVERLIMHILKPHEKDHIYDPTVGSGGFLLEAFHYTREKEGEHKARSLYLYGQEKELATFAIGKINMFLHGLDGADIRRGDTLASPQFLTEAGLLQQFDIVVANFPYSIKEWPYLAFAKDRFGRSDGYDLPPAKNADYGFILHIIKSLNTNGKAGVVVPLGVLFRAGVEGKIRERIVRNDLLEAVISLPPKLFYGTSIPAAIIILNRNKQANRKGKVLFVDAENCYEAGKKQNRLRRQDIERVSEAVSSFKPIDHFASVVDQVDLEKAGFNLNVRRHVDLAEVDSLVEPKKILDEIIEMKAMSSSLSNQAKAVITGEGVFETIDTPIGKIPAEWTLVNAEGLTDGSKGSIKIGPFGSSLKKEYLQPEGYKIYGQENVFANNFEIGDRFINEQRFKLLAVNELKPGDFVISMMGTIGQCAIVPENIKAGIMDSHLLRVRLDPVRVNPQYLLQLFSSPVIQRQVVKLSVGGIMSGLSSKVVKSILFPLPPRSEQDRIAATISEIEYETQLYDRLRIASRDLRDEVLGRIISGKLKA